MAVSRLAYTLARDAGAEHSGDSCSFYLHRGFGVTKYSTKRPSRAGRAGLTPKAAFEVQSHLAAALSPLHDAVQRLTNKVDAAATQLSTLSKNVGELEGRVRDVEEAAKPDVLLGGPRSPSCRVRPSGFHGDQLL